MLCNTSFSRLLASCMLLGFSTPAIAADFAQITRSEGKPAGEYAFKDAAGKTHGLKEFRGRLLAVHFWATWCVPCISEIKDVDRAVKNFEDFNIGIITISLDGDNITKVKNFFTDQELKNLTPYIDVNMKSFQNAKIGGLPSTVFIDSKGNEIARVEGALDWNGRQLREFVQDNVP